MLLKAFITIYTHDNRICPITRIMTLTPEKKLGYMSLTTTGPMNLFKQTCMHTLHCITFHCITVHHVPHMHTCMHAYIHTYIHTYGRQTGRQTDRQTDRQTRIYVRVCMRNMHVCIYIAIHRLLDVYNVFFGYLVLVLCICILQSEAPEAPAYPFN